MPNGAGILTASIILAIMILPFMAATLRELLLTVPPQVRESAYGLGATTRRGGDERSPCPTSAAARSAR